MLYAECESQTALSVGPGEDLVVVPQQIVQPRGSHFVSTTLGQRTSAPRLRGIELFESAGGGKSTTGKKPPSVPRDGTYGYSYAVSHEGTPARQPGPLHLHSPGLSPIPSLQGKVGGEEEELVADEEDGRNVGVAATAATAAAELDEGEDEEEEEEEEGEEEEEEEKEEEEEDSEKLISMLNDAPPVRALGDEFEGQRNDETLRSLSMLGESDMSLNTTARTRRQSPLYNSAAATVADAGATFRIILDGQGSPVLVPLRGAATQAPSSILSPGLPLSPGRSSSTSQGMGSRYWKDRLHRRQIGSILGSPQLQYFFY